MAEVPQASCVTRDALIALVALLALVALFAFVALVAFVALSRLLRDALGVITAGDRRWAVGDWEAEVLGKVSVRASVKVG